LSSKPSFIRNLQISKQPVQMSLSIGGESGQRGEEVQPSSSQGKERNCRWRVWAPGEGRGAGKGRSLRAPRPPPPTPRRRRRRRRAAQGGRACGCRQQLQPPAPPPRPRLPGLSPSSAGSSRRADPGKVPSPGADMPGSDTALTVDRTYSDPGRHHRCKRRVRTAHREGRWAGEGTDDGGGWGLAPRLRTLAIPLPRGGGPRFPDSERTGGTSESPS
jgi:hypothetical protein